MIYKTPKNILAMTTPRSGGVSSAPYDSNNLSFTVKDKKENVISNRKALSKKLNIPLEHFVFARQCHSDQIQKVSKEDASKGSLSHEDGIADVDALYTFEDDLVLTFFHADCVPILFYDLEAHLIGAIHAGTVGTLKEITKKSMTKVIQIENLDPRDIKVIIGPALSYKSSHIDPKTIPVEYSENEKIQLKDGFLKIDAVGLNIDQLLACGIPLENIDNQTQDTFSNPNDYFSFQRDNETGRHLSFIVQVSDKES